MYLRDFTVIYKHAVNCGKVLLYFPVLQTFIDFSLYDIIQQCFMMESFHFPIQPTIYSTKRIVFIISILSHANSKVLCDITLLSKLVSYITISAT